MYIDEWITFKKCNFFVHTKVSVAVWMIMCWCLQKKSPNKHSETQKKKKLFLIDIVFLPPLLKLKHNPKIKSKKKIINSKVIVFVYVLCLLLVVGSLLMMWSKCIDIYLKIH